ncbi:DUF1285 domain-containing protein [Novosphingobium mangrovi (ex Huang et al. 2023)]|uniref:DUF1285 domain-containing protein n=1 Tax=Novosphingobium mangrovi (ex Huang et al. 2023) TaxID=2976432 RepID=A0ABT2I442_9SPHN|nr:DUF1285 domain-containing protein [Novosphingobium mangrovi (ex Huang et al. 2023)]MCT2399403.1 DUF1285 domain-containing protein [Novosphingobium mangrovi (ex Huang et al. 2023)]
MPYEPPPELAALSLGEVAELVAARKLPPVSQWSPEAVGDSEMRIAADGRWFHQGGEIKRAAMVRAFASLLMRDEDGQHWLVTPSQKLSIDVDDAAFIAIDVKQEDGALAFRLNTDDLVIADAEHPIRAEGDPDTPALYLGVRGGTEARLNRSTYGQLAEIALAGGDLSVTSRGTCFSLRPA